MRKLQGKEQWKTKSSSGVCVTVLLQKMKYFARSWAGVSVSGEVAASSAPAESAKRTQLRRGSPRVNLPNEPNRESLKRSQFEVCDTATVVTVHKRTRFEPVGRPCLYSPLPPRLLADALAFAGTSGSSFTTCATDSGGISVPSFEFMVLMVSFARIAYPVFDG